MKAEQWVIGVGTTFLLIVVIAAMLPDSLWSDGNVSRGTAAVDTATETAAADVAAAGQNSLASALVPFSKATSGNFAGRVVRVVSLGSDTGWGQVHIWVDNGSGTAQEVSVAPDWYLQNQGCTVAENAQVRGTAFRFGPDRPDTEVYARNITVNGSSCNLRNDEGFALWSNRMR